VNLRRLALALLLAGAARAQLSADPPVWTIDPPLAPGQSATHVVRLRNDSGAAVHITSLKGEGPVLAALHSRDIGPHETTNLVLSLQPLSEPGDIDACAILALDHGGPLILPVHGRIEIPPPILPPEVLTSHYTPQPSDHAVHALVFYNRLCGECAAFVENVVKPLQRYFGPAVSFEIADLTEPATFARAGALKTAYGLDRDANTYLFCGATALAGPDIDRALYPLLLRELGRPTPMPPLAAPPATRLGSLGALLAAGVIDGLNPCAFATAVFLIALLTRLGGDRRRLLAVGGAFTAAVFVTYSLIGLGVLGALGWFEGKLRAATLLRRGVAALAVVFAAGQGRDVWRLRRGAPTRDLTMSLPPRVLAAIHAVLRAMARPTRSTLGATLAGAGAAAAVTALEMVCTSQVYLAVLVGLRASPWRAKLIWLVLGYNLGFIGPLLVVLALSWRGVSSERLARAARRHLGAAKLLLAALLISLATWLLAPEWAHLRGRP
jgi:cytochrome c biogenesis protein CcdA